MCYFPLPNLNFSGEAYRKGIQEFDCGACPECLHKRSNLWALTSVYEAKCHLHNCMITLTYDNFVFDSSGHIIGETPVNPDLKVNKRHVQLFLKRLRKWYSTVSDEKIKYRCCAEYGSTTHRAHYHLILFGVCFPDIHFYKKSKRGNPIYLSSILTSLWKFGICTVDSINVGASIARYCSKYLAKSRSEKTFTLSSHHIGVEALLRDFNGKYYMIDGRQYPVPRTVWQLYISDKYSSPLFTYKYVNKIYDQESGLCLNPDEYSRNFYMRKMYRCVRDSDEVYQSYLKYWSDYASIFERNKLSVGLRILQLSGRYHFYKSAALECLRKRKCGIPAVAPGSLCSSAYYRYREQVLGLPTLSEMLCLCPSPSRLNRANDTKFSKNRTYKFLRSGVLIDESLNSPPTPKFFYQISFFS